jgi:transcription antitermination factor NusG
MQVFYREAEHTTNPKTNRVLDAMKKSQIDMYSLWRGRHCVVISGPFKGHRGTVKTTHPDGRIGVQLDTRLSQMTEFKFDEILVQE